MTIIINNKIIHNPLMKIKQVQDGLIIQFKGRAKNTLEKIYSNRGQGDKVFIRLSEYDKHNDDIRILSFGKLDLKRWKLSGNQVEVGFTPNSGIVTDLINLTIGERLTEDEPQIMAGPTSSKKLNHDYYDR